jgi:predicted SPOUT superfamily RNA methylase MTH1
VRTTGKNLKYDIAIPDSYLYGVKTDIDKTLKIFQLARTLSIFRINNINIFHDKVLNPAIYERQFLSTILEYLDTPQYLRKKIYPMSEMLKTVGRLHPIRSPHHKDKVDIKYLKSGDIRVGLIEKKIGTLCVDVGLDSLVNYDGKFNQVGKKINVRLVRRNRQLRAVDVTEQELSNLFWGYSVRYFPDLKKVIERYNPSNLILTSKYSKHFDKDELQFQISEDIKVGTTILVIFGSPKYGLDMIFEKEGIDMKKYQSFNFFPFQGTQTVRLEEAILGVLSILNSCLK